VDLYFRISSKIARFSLVGLVAACGGPDLGTPPAVCSTHAVDEGESALMEPGGNCIQCHSDYDGPHFTFAGTVMSATRDDTNCAGVSDVIVRIKGADGKAIELTTNQNGNFYSDVAVSSIAFPYTAEVTRGGKTVAMLTSRTQSETNCASCHTAVGANDAPGRITAP
jgi:cytochrome c553